MFEAVWWRPEGGVDSPGRAALFIISKENNQQRSRAACWSFPRWWQDGLWDISFYPLLQILWQRWMARWKKVSWGWVSSQWLCLFVFVQIQGLMNHGQNHDIAFWRRRRKKCVTDRTWKKLLSLFWDETFFRLKIHNFTFLARVCEVQKCTISNRKRKHQRRIVQSRGDYASGSNKSNKLHRCWQPNIFFFPLWNALRAAITLNKMMQGRRLPA